MRRTVTAVHVQGTQREDFRHRSPGLRLPSGAGSERGCRLGSQQPRHPRWSRPWALRCLLASLTATLTLAACDSRPPTAARSTAPATGPSTTTHRAPSCSSAQLRLRFIDEDVATGTRIIGVTVINGGSDSCNVAGFPQSVTLIGSHGPLSTTVQHMTTAPTPSVKPTDITLRPGGRASFLLTMGDGSILPLPHPSCPMITGLSVRLRRPRRSVGFSLSGDFPKPSALVRIHAFPYHPDGKCNGIDVSFLVKGSPRALMTPLGTGRAAR